MPAAMAPGGPGAFDVDTLPVLVAYRNGELVSSLVRCCDNLPASFTESDVEGLLADEGLFDEDERTAELPYPAGVAGQERHWSCGNDPNGSFSLSEKDSGSESDGGGLGVD